MVGTPVKTLIIVSGAFINSPGTVFYFCLPIEMFIDEPVHGYPGIESQFIKSGIDVSIYLCNIDPSKEGNIQVLSPCGKGHGNEQQANNSKSAKIVFYVRHS